MKNKRKGKPVNRLLMGHQDFLELAGKRRMLEPWDSSLCPDTNIYRVISAELLGQYSSNPEGLYSIQGAVCPLSDCYYEKHAARQLDDEWCPITGETSPYANTYMPDIRMPILF